MVRVMSTLLKENLADEELSRWDLDKSFFKGQISVASDFRILGGFLGCSDVRKAI